ncbi:hypothetical protein H7B67_16305 [Cohnella thailandensis]|uniref:Tyr recombinase domain-containing protein n=2 Tax=Cohnella thailandensis TaxID=557557 RepID=A0A841STN3_9BACL|nr:hypothetical protein [Cohnella thailandensis]
MLRMGQNVKVVADRLGHTNAAMTLNVYAHATIDMQQEAVDHFERIMKKSKATKRA